MSDAQIMNRLPENAYRELKPGETYVPMISPHASVPEITLRSIVFGIATNIVFSIAATFLALKAGQGIETAIPISILSVGLSGLLLRLGRRRSSLLENINILAIGATSGIVAGGTCFTLPAIYVLRLHEKLGMGSLQLFLQIFLVPFLGAVLGVLFLVPFRRYFVREMHGKFPFPEGTATNEILAAGAAGGGKQAWILVYSFLLAMVYNFLSTGLKLFAGVFTTGELVLKTGKTAVNTLAFGTPFFHDLTHHVKAVFSLGTGAYFLGLGFIIGLRWAAIICAGSFLSWFVIVPLLAPFELEHLKLLNPHPEFTDTSATSIWWFVPRNIGIGGIFAAGIITILKMSRVIVTALRQALSGLFRSKQAPAQRDRTDEDMSYTLILVLGILTTIGMALYFRFLVLQDMPNPTRLTIISVLLALAVSFVFTTVSAWAIAVISTTPISGMTVTTVIITAVVLLGAGLPKGEGGMLATLLVGGVVCTALSMAGTLVTEFKLGYWLGASPKRIQWSSIIACVLASAVVTVTIMFLAFRPGYLKTPETPDALAAPQANMIASAIDAFVGQEGRVPWLLYGTGAVVSVVLQMLGISPLPFALGMYLPLEINTAVLAGAFVAWLVGRGSADEALRKARGDKGILVASGLIAGGAIIEVLIVAVGVFDEMYNQNRIMNWLDFTQSRVDAGTSPDAVARAHNWLGLAAFVVLCLFVCWDCRRARPDRSGP